MKMLIPFLLLSIGIYSDQADWNKEYDKNGIKIYTRNVGNSSVKEYRGVVEVKATPSYCVAQIKDLKKYSKFMYKTTHSEMVKVVSDNEWIMYCIVDFPWPYNDRDLVMKYTVYPMGKEVYKVKFYSLDGMVPKKDGYERMHNLSGSWTFEPVVNGITRATHESKASTDGFPSWLVNMFILDAPKHIMPSFRTQVEG